MKKKRKYKVGAQQLIEETILLLYRGSFQSLRWERKGNSKKGAGVFPRENSILLDIIFLPLETESRIKNNGIAFLWDKTNQV